jgi:hypothetical protein
VGTERPQRVPSVEVVAAVGRHDRDRRREASREQEAQHLARRLVGPVHVLDEHQQRGRLAQRGQSDVHRLEQPCSVEPLGVQLVGGGEHAPARHQSGDVGARLHHRLGHVRLLLDQPPEHLAEREVGQGAVAEVEAVSDHNPPPRGDRAGPQLGQHAGLAHAGVAAEQDSGHRRVAGLQAEQGLEPLELVTAADQGPGLRRRG